MRAASVRFCPRCLANRRFVGPAPPWRAPADMVLGLARQDDTGLGWRELACETCRLPARRAARTAFPT